MAPSFSDMSRCSGHRPVPSSELVVQVVSWLYTEQVKPFGRILRLAVARRHGVEDRSVNSAELLEVCRSCAELQVEDCETDWCVNLRGVSDDELVDVHKTDQFFKDAVWQAAESYFKALPKNEVLPGGRYKCALELRAKKLGFLEDFTLGRLCQFVRVAEEEKMLLGNSGSGGLVPYHGSESKRIHDYATEKRPMCKGPAYTCIDRVIADLRMILKRSSDAIPLPNIKRDLLKQSGLTLSETAFGKTTLLLFLKEDPQLKELFEVTQQPKGYYVSILLRPICLHELLGAKAVPATPHTAVPTPGTPTPLSTAATPLIFPSPEFLFDPTPEPLFDKTPNSASLGFGCGMSQNLHVDSPDSACRNLFG